MSRSVLAACLGRLQTLKTGAVGYVVLTGETASGPAGPEAESATRQTSGRLSLWSTQQEQDSEREVGPDSHKEEGKGKGKEESEEQDAEDLWNLMLGHKAVTANGAADYQPVEPSRGDRRL